MDWELEYSADLESFAKLTSGLEVIDDDPDELVFRLTNPALIKGFFRVRAVMP